MVAEGTSAQVTVFPGGEGDAGARRLWETLGRLAGPSGSWSGTQAELAACFTPRVSERTLRRWMNALRADDVLQTRGTGTALEYALLRWPAGMQGGSQRATRAAIRWAFIWRLVNGEHGASWATSGLWHHTHRRVEAGSRTHRLTLNSHPSMSTTPFAQP